MAKVYLNFNLELDGSELGESNLGSNLLALLESAAKLSNTRGLTSDPAANMDAPKKSAPAKPAPAATDPDVEDPAVTPVEPEGDGLDDETTSEASTPPAKVKKGGKKADAKAKKVKPEELREAVAACSKICGKEKAIELIKTVGKADKLALVAEENQATLRDAFADAVAAAEAAEDAAPDEDI